MSNLDVTSFWWQHRPRPRSYSDTKSIISQHLENTPKDNSDINGQSLEESKVLISGNDAIFEDKNNSSDSVISDVIFPEASSRPKPSRHFKMSKKSWYQDYVTTKEKTAFCSRI